MSAGNGNSQHCECYVLCCILPSGQALCLYAAHVTVDQHSVSPGLGEHAPNSSQTTRVLKKQKKNINYSPSPGSCAGSEELVPVDVCSSHSLHLQHQLWSPPTDPAPHECLGLSWQGSCANIAGSSWRRG